MISPTLLYPPRRCGVGTGVGDGAGVAGREDAASVSAVGFAGLRGCSGTREAVTVWLDPCVAGVFEGARTFAAAFVLIAPGVSSIDETTCVPGVRGASSRLVDRARSRSRFNVSSLVDE